MKTFEAQTSIIQTDKVNKAKNRLIDLLESGRYKPGERLPQGSDLVKVLECSRYTAREAVVQLIDEGYLLRIHGNGTYVAPRRRQTRTIAAFFPDMCRESIGTNIISPIISAIVEEAGRHGADVLLYGCSSDNLSVERDNIRRAIDRRVDAAILWYAGAEKNLDALEELYESGIPIVFVDRYVEKFNCDYAVTDSIAGTFDAVNAIAKLGVENIYYITDTEWCTTIRDRVVGYTSAVNSLGLSSNVVYINIGRIIIRGNPDAAFDKKSSEYISLKRTIENIRFPAALLSPNPNFNAIIYEVLEDLNIPKDQTILGHFDSDPPTRRVDRCYIEIAQPIDEIGAAAVQMALDKIGGGTELRQIALKPKLTIHNLSLFAKINPEADSTT